MIYDKWDHEEWLKWSKFLEFLIDSGNMCKERDLEATIFWTDRGVIIGMVSNGRATSRSFGYDALNGYDEEGLARELQEAYDELTNDRKE